LHSTWTVVVAATDMLLKTPLMKTYAPAATTMTAAPSAMDPKRRRDGMS
jgi:hypothetical protein